jgi:hypothetical protein
MLARGERRAPRIGSCRRSSTPADSNPGHLTSQTAGPDASSRLVTPGLGSGAFTETDTALRVPTGGRGVGHLEEWCSTYAVRSFSGS